MSSLSFFTNYTNIFTRERPKPRPRKVASDKVVDITDDEKNLESKTKYVVNIIYLRYLTKLFYREDKGKGVMTARGRFSPDWEEEIMASPRKLYVFCY